MNTSIIQQLSRATLVLGGWLLVSLPISQPVSAAESSPSLRAVTTADHGKFKELQGPFASGPEVTKACLGCHTEASKQVHKSLHWTWDYTHPKTGQRLGKKNVINNFCGSLATNEPRCTSCHIGFGWKDDKFDFASETNVDCLVCHDTTGAYKKFPTDAGHPNYVPKEFPPGKPWPVVDLAKVAQKVGSTSRDTCGACHFTGGGGDAVKHGDLDTSLKKPTRALDVHMGTDGANFSCSTCHTTRAHITAGSRFATKATDDVGIDVPGRSDGGRATCESCHGATPHKGGAEAQKMNRHTDRVACSTCHVPEFARAQPTKTLWDWSTAGKLKDGKPFIVKNEHGEASYDTMKGNFEWAANVVPTYRWFNGDIGYTLADQKIDDTRVVPINTLGGSADDPKARIWPFKAMRGKQPYDTENKVLLMNHVFGKDDSAFWGNFDWGKALAFAAKATNAVYSGKFGFVESVYYWPITHMVAPKEKALACVQCHSTDGRLKDLAGGYIPGRDRIGWLEFLGWALAAATLAGVLFHLVIRLVSANRARQS